MMRRMNFNAFIKKHPSSLSLVISDTIIFCMSDSALALIFSVFISVKDSNQFGIIIVFLSIHIINNLHEVFYATGRQFLYNRSHQVQVGQEHQLRSHPKQPKKNASTQPTATCWTKQKMCIGYWRIYRQKMFGVLVEESQQNSRL